MKPQLVKPILVLSPVVIDQGAIHKMILHFIYIYIFFWFFGGVVNLCVVVGWRLVELLSVVVLHDTVHVQLRMNYHTIRPKFVCAYSSKS